MTLSTASLPPTEGHILFAVVLILLVPPLIFAGMTVVCMMRFNLAIMSEMKSKKQSRFDFKAKMDVMVRSRLKHRDLFRKMLFYFLMSNLTFAVPFLFLFAYIEIRTRL